MFRMNTEVPPCIIDVSHVYWCFSCILMFPMYSDVSHVYWCSPCILMFPMYTDVSYVYWCFPCILMFPINTDFSHVYWCFPCMLMFPMYTDVSHVELGFPMYTEHCNVRCTLIWTMIFLKYTDFHHVLRPSHLHFSFPCWLILFLFTLIIPFLRYSQLPQIFPLITNDFFPISVNAYMFIEIGKLNIYICILHNLFSIY